MMGGCAGSPTMADGSAGGDCSQFPAQSSSSYVLPYPAGVTLFVGRTSEHGDPQRYAIDWYAPINTAVVAARGGRVIATESRWADTDHTFGHENYVFVEHPDGTVARYFHLTEGGVLAIAGQMVAAGDRLGYSGNSGNSTAPHIHFDVVRTACGGQWPGDAFDSPCQRTIPVVFRNTRPHACGIQTGEAYLAGPI
jgi:murein DD-endopeptidase MepM/ murein hydrolase activator NlpD